MKFYIQTLNDNGSGMKYNTKEECLKKISLMIDDCMTNGGTFISFDVDSDTSCFDIDDEKYVPSAENGDYSPSNPWDAPGMSIRDFI